ncbi:hypothetical protein J7E50_02910 [Pedobacter sp. ISL-68]|uniref:hypothetical protein n=1 Tax=unclassified Pedobacter TaxID=2628915 RepID=UPI001BEB4178|nr:MULTISPECIES: hypothetical protein [unclassified Pedobacter]MBT2560171.1 hypothetical protein [Pedobacter sp. ISL-64]MBT2589150.1 hypothetical protein [Pedobacter sp. ISL-68]
MKTVHLNLYPFAELSEDAREKALNDHRFINVDDAWWDSIYEDANQSGLKINGFEFDTGYYCNAEFTEDAIFCAGKILDAHGENTPTYQTALSFWTRRNGIVAGSPKDQNAEFENVEELDDLLDKAEDDFLTAIRWEYHSLLIREYNCQTSDTAITETLEANDYHFTADGKLATRIEKLSNELPLNQ